MDDRTVLFIDGANMYATARALNFTIDYRKLLDVLQDQYGLNIIRANYYTAIRDTRSIASDRENDPLIGLIDWLSYNGYKTITKRAMTYHDGDGEIMKGNMDVEMTVDAMSMSDRFDHLILGTGDGDFTYLVDWLHRKGVQVTAISTIQTNPPMIASALRKEVDSFIDLGDANFKSLIARAPLR